MQRVVLVSKSILASFVSLAFVVSIASAEFPSFGHSSEKTTAIDIAQSAQVPNIAVLKAGTYKVAVQSDSPTTQVSFYQNGKLVGRAPAEVVDEARKSDETEVHVNGAGGNNILTEIDVNGWT